MPERYDVTIIGTGADVGTLAHTLAPSGKKILLIERGDFLPRERENWEPDPVSIEGRYISPTPGTSPMADLPATGPLRRSRDTAGLANGLGIDHPTSETVATFLDAVRARTPSWTWRVSQQQLDSALEVGRRWTVERYGSTDIRLEDRIWQRWWIFDVR